MYQISKEKWRRKRITWKQIVAFVMLITMFFTQQGMLEVFAAESNLSEQETVSESDISVIDTDETEENKDGEEESENEETEAEDEETESDEKQDLEIESSETNSGDREDTETETDETKETETNSEQTENTDTEDSGTETNETESAEAESNDTENIEVESDETKGTETENTEAEDATTETDETIESKDTETSEVEEASSEIVVTGFEGYDGFQPLYRYEVEYGCLMEELPLPQEITAYVLTENIEENTQENVAEVIPVTWVCVDDSMGGSEYLPEHENKSVVYTFIALLEEGYVLQEGMNPAWDMPYVTISYGAEKKEGTKETQETLTLDVTFPSKYYDSETSVLELYYNSTTEISTTITGTTVTNPILKISVPEKMNITYYPNASDATLGPNLVETNPVSMTTENGITTLTYRFKEKVAQTGFNITVKPVYQLTDGNEYEIKAQYYDGDVFLKEASTTFTVDNPTVKKGFYPAVDFKEIKEYSLTNADGIYDVPMNKGFSSGTSDHYPYEKTTVTVLIPSEAVPGVGQGANFTALSESVTWTAKAGWKVTYYKNQPYSNKTGTISGTSDVLVYEPSEKFLQGYGIESFNNQIYLRFTNPQAGTISTNITPKIVITADGKESCIYDHQTMSTYRCYGVTFKEYDISDYFYLTSAASSSHSLDSSYIIKGYESSYKSRIFNKTGEVMRNVKVSYTFDEKICVPKIQLNLKNANNVCPAKAQIVYKTKNSGDTLLYKELSADENTLSLTEDYFTYIEVTYDKIGNTGSSYYDFLTASLYHYENEPDTAAHKITAQLLSAERENAVIYEPETEIVEEKYYLKNSDKLYFFRKVTNITTGVGSNVALNKGDTFSIEVYSNGKGYVKNPGIYLLMPKGYIFKGYTAPGDYREGEYTVTSQEVGNGKILYGVQYTDNIDYPVSYVYHEFQFIVGPEVNTSQVQADVKLPENIYISSDHDTFLLEKENIKESSGLDKDGDGTADALDINGDGDTEDFFYGLTWTPDITINSVVALTTQSFLSSSRQSGEDVNQKYEFDSTGTYKFYIFNGFQSGQAVKDAEIEIPIPRKGETVTWKEETYISQWDVKVTGPISVEGKFLEEAEITYSTDGSTYADSVEDYSKVCRIKIKTAADKTLASEETAIVKIPFKVAFHEEMTAGKTYETYWETDMKYKTASEESVVATVQPSTLTAMGKTLSGTIYKDHNGNGIQEDTENVNGESYTWKLYSQEGTNGDYLIKGSSNSSSGKYSVEVLVPGTYTLKVEKADTEYYVSNSYFNSDGCYTFTVGENGSSTPWKNINLGILAPRTMKTNFTSVDLKQGEDTRTIVPTLTPALMTGEEAVSFSSNDTSVVTVSDDGKLTVTGEGSTTVTVKVPQLKALVNQGVDAYITQEIKVNCQLAGCHIKTEPLVKTSSSSSAADIGDKCYIYLSSSGSKSQYFYYYYENEGYCNENAHDSTNAVTAEVVSQGNTDATITVYSSRTSYKCFQLKVSKPGVVKVKFQREWGHGDESKPDDREVTIYVMPYQLESPQIVISPENSDGDNGWYKTIPNITIVSNADTDYVDTWISTDDENYEILREDNQPNITESGIYSYALYNKVRLEDVEKVSSTIESNIKVDIVAPIITNVVIENGHAKISLEDNLSGISRLDYKLSNQDYQSVDVENGQAVISLPSSVEDTLIFCPADIAGNAGSVRSIKNIAGFWVLENDAPFLHQEGEGIEENELKASVLVIDTGSGITRDKITLTQNGQTLSADSYIIEETENGYRVMVNSQGITTANPILLKVVDNQGQESSMEIVSEATVYTISYDGGEGAQGQTPETTKVVEGQEYVMASNPYTKEGWTFCGWYFGNKLYQPGQKIVIGAESIVFRALWEKSETKSANVLAVEAAIRYLPEPDATDEEILNAETDICDTKERYEALEDGEQEQVDSSLKEKLAELLARLMTIETKIEAEVRVEASNLNEIAQLLNLTEDVTDENLNTPHEEVKVTITMKLDKIEDNDVIEGKEDIVGSNQGKEMEFFDISILKEITKKVNGTSTTESGTINQLPKELEISIELSEEAKKGSNHKVFRYHDGDVEQLVSKREGNNLIFYTDKFSTYAVIYDPYTVAKDSDSSSENKQDNGNESGQEYENENNGGIIAALVMSKTDKDRGALDQVPKTGQNNLNGYIPVKVECIIRKKEWDADREDVEE